MKKQVLKMYDDLQEGEKLRIILPEGYKFIVTKDDLLCSDDDCCSLTLIKDDKEIQIAVSGILFASKRKKIMEEL